MTEKDSSAVQNKRVKTLIACAVMAVATVGVFFLIRHRGETTSAVSSSGSSALLDTAGRNQVDDLLHVLLAIVVIIVVTRSVGALFKRLGQPQVVGEIIGGILLGPSLLGRLAPGFAAYVLPHGAAPLLGVISQLGVIMYMFMVGLGFSMRVIRRNVHSTIAISNTGIMLPFLLGSAFALTLYKTMAGPGVSFTVFALFMGVSMSVTAFPVLARILTDRGVQQTRLGTLALTCAAVDDITTWCVLAVTVSIAQARARAAILTLFLTFGLVAVVFLVIGPLFRHWLPMVEKKAKFNRTWLAVFLVAMLLSALATEYVGIHAIFGAFMIGAIIPNHSGVAKELKRRLEDLVSVMFLPVFFAFTGMRTQIGLIGGLHNWAICGLLILIACIGKFGGSLMAGRATGLSWRDSSALGILMNTRGLVELIVLNIGLDLGVISPALFTMLVITALVTTFLTTPLLSVVMSGRTWD